MRCKRCGDDEDRIHGFCGVRCEELHELEEEMIDLEQVLEDLDKWLEEEIHGAWASDQDTREGALICVVNKIKKLKEANQ